VAAYLNRRRAASLVAVLLRVLLLAAFIQTPAELGDSAAQLTADARDAPDAEQQQHDDQDDDQFGGSKVHDFDLQRFVVCTPVPSAREPLCNSQFARHRAIRGGRARVAQAGSPLGPLFEG
jgi:hypothetical protein